ncbi:hypothetical protein BV22DRAFT_1134285 [Leucogyrophana mollusca]|uniref:Uncharacterized protein n=1 Tax=Leucogyrophana mollusca TaxID=85980 RepID=A0ACB8AZA1_9AGAM|nr:hypothetical protein BV22DRAFT_1134285 [Leucogyrophana mollusca]
MSSTSPTSPDVIACLLNVVKNNTKALPYSDVEELEKFTELATATVESMRCVERNLVPLLASHDLARQAKAAKNIAADKSSAQQAADKSHAQLARLQRPMSRSVTPDSPSLLPTRPSSSSNLHPTLALWPPTLYLPSPRSSPLSRSLLPSLAHPPSLLRCNQDLKKMFQVNEMWYIWPNDPRNNIATIAEFKPLFLPSPPCVCSPPIAPTRLVTSVAVCILESPRSPSPASPMEVEEVEPSIIVKRRKGAPVVVSAGSDTASVPLASEHKSLHRDELEEEKAPAPTSVNATPAPKLSTPLAYFSFKNLQIPMYHEDFAGPPPAIGHDEDGNEVFPIVQ